MQRSRFNIATPPLANIFMCLMVKVNGYSYQENSCSNHRPGDVVIYDTMKPYRHSFPADMEMIVVDIPRNIANEILGKSSINDR